MWLKVLLLSITLVDGEMSEAVYPSNTAVISGSNFSFVCGTISDGVTPQWKFRKENIYGELLLYNGTHIMEAFKDIAVVTTTKGLSILAKNISKEADAGTYICIEKNKSDSVPRISSAQLIILDNDPVCKVNKENIVDGEFLEMECTVNYTGSISPVIKWSRSDGINPDSHDNITTCSVVSKLTTNMTIEDHAVTFMSNIFFNQPLPSNDKTGVHKATNAPNNEYIWTHKPNVLYAPKSVNIAPKKEVYTIGDILHCVANGNPSPSYEWTELESTEVISRLSSLTIDSTRMENRAYKCTATNDVSGKETPSISTTVTIHSVRRPSAGFDPVRDITIAAGVVCVILFLVVFVVVIRRFKECLRSFVLREAETGPDIVQNADRDENDGFPAVNAPQYMGYAQPDDLGIRRPPLEQRGFAAEARGNGYDANCNQGPVPEGFPVYDEIGNLQGAASIQKDVGIPVYGKVSKSSKVGQTQSQEELPVYGKVQKKRDEQAPYSGKAASTLEAEEKQIQETLESESCYPSSSKKVIIGADGTEYMEMSAARSLMQSEAAPSPSQHPLFNRSQYVEIDHTKSASK